MQKLIDKFKANPSRETAARVVAYLRKHPMAECLLSLEDHAAVVQARREAEG